jgi:hypothetical protein
MLKNIKTLIITISAVIVIGAVFFLSGFSMSARPGLTFYTKRCSEPGPAIQKINKIEQKNKLLIVQTTISPNCAADRVIGDYEIKGDKLLLDYQEKVKGSIAACICPRKAVYIIDNAKQQNYQVSFKY